MRAPLSFGAVDRLHRSAEFIRLQRSGMRFQSRHFVLYAGTLETEPERSRLGVTVSRRIGNAVVRNRVKRRVREIFRGRIRDTLKPGTSLVVIATAGAGSLATASIADELVTGARNLSARISVMRN